MKAVNGCIKNRAGDIIMSNTIVITLVGVLGLLLVLFYEDHACSMDLNS